MGILHRYQSWANDALTWRRDATIALERRKDDGSLFPPGRSDSPPLLAGWTLVAFGSPQAGKSAFLNECISSPDAPFSEHVLSLATTKPEAYGREDRAVWPAGDKPWSDAALFLGLLQKAEPILGESLETRMGLRFREAWGFGVDDSGSIPEPVRDLISAETGPGGLAVLLLRADAAVSRYEFEGLRVLAGLAHPERLCVVLNVRGEMDSADRDETVQFAREQAKKAGLPDSLPILALSARGWSEVPGPARDELDRVVHRSLAASLLSEARDAFRVALVSRFLGSEEPLTDWAKEVRDAASIAESGLDAARREEEDARREKIEADRAFDQKAREAAIRYERAVGAVDAIAASSPRTAQSLVDLLSDLAGVSGGEPNRIPDGIKPHPLPWIAGAAIAYAALLAGLATFGLPILAASLVALLAPAAAGFLGKERVSRRRRAVLAETVEAVRRDLAFEHERLAGDLESARLAAEGHHSERIDQARQRVTMAERNVEAAHSESSRVEAIRQRRRKLAEDVQALVPEESNAATRR